ncbi:hypothetical protein MN116_005266 [Schistosoma mekongi]|uniref:Protein SERAC1 n=1 Tax=Schistosoma mekongi TaxID=38744 RepID=A0AAE2D5E7_SCHME|nr:hypothetical protein MN116_005266 [Schistosoma mekongi]
MWTLMSAYIFISDGGSFPQIFLYAVKATSTLCIIWSAYVIVKTRLFWKRDSDTHEGTDHKKRKYEHCNESEVSTSCDNDSTEQNLLSLSFLKDGVIFRNSINALYNLIHKHNDDDFDAAVTRTTAASDNVTSTNENSPSDELSLFYQMIYNLSVKAGITTDDTYPTSRKRSRLLSFSKVPKLSTDYILRLLISYSKDLRYLDLLFHCEHFERLVDWLISISFSAFNINSEQSNASLIDPHHTSPSVDQLLLDKQEWTNESYHYSNDNNSIRRDSLFLDVNGMPNPHSEYPIHLLVANFLANISQHPSSSILNNYEEIRKLICLWKASPSLHLNLFGAKIDHNLKVYSQIVNSSSNLLNTFPIYCPDVYNLNDSNDINEDYDFDIIFVNGMLGSVFYTWRQHDSMLTNNPTTYTKCWPKDWLSHRFPRARIIGIDTSLKPFVWHSICPLQKLRRSLDKRAIDIMKQLKQAEVGCRPIIWITHSAGGILVKEMLRLSGSTNSGHSELSTVSNTEYLMHASHTHSDLSVSSEGNHSVPLKNFQPSSTVDSPCKWYCPETDQEYESTSSNSNLISPGYEDRNPSASDKHLEHRIPYPFSSSYRLFNHNSDASLTSSSNDSQIDSVNFQSFGNSTRAIVFMSTPHRGNQSMLTLYRRPFRWALTPEAIQLERNSNYLLDLHVWFNMWAFRHAVQVLSLVESRVTPINRFWSVLLVPEDIKDEEMGKVIRIDSDHLYISKPMNHTDLSYTSIVHFIENLTFFNELPVVTTQESF